MNLTPELLADLRSKAEAARLTSGKSVSSSAVGSLHQTLLPSVVLALLDRIEALERDVADSQAWDRSRVE